jgi:hypothetical protein
MSVLPDLIELARSRDIRAVAEQLLSARLKKVTAAEFAGPCPSCGGTDRFSVNVRKQLWNCRGFGGGDVIKLVRHVEGVSFSEAVERLTGEEWKPKRAPARTAERSKDDADHGREQHAKARWIWGRRQPLIGSVAERYLREVRAYNGPLPPTLAFLPPYKDHPPSLICAFALPSEVEPGVLVEPCDVQSVQLIALKSDGSGKADKADVKDGVIKRHIGAHKGLPIVVSPVNDGLGLSIHEGVEDALSAYEATGLGSWASGGATFLAALADAIPAYVECVTVAEHKDAAGQNGAHALARCLTERGVEVLLGGGANG